MRVQVHLACSVAPRDFPRLSRRRLSERVRFIHVDSSPGLGRLIQPPPPPLPRALKFPCLTKASPYVGTHPSCDSLAPLHSAQRRNCCFTRPG